MLNPEWQPTSTLNTLKHRAAILAQIRNFFANKNILEVDTPLMCHATVTDPHVVGIPALFKPYGKNTEQTFYLQTSPEYAMKRLLASGSGPIYQICKAFRQGEVGKIHNPEFTMLEWYQPGYDHHQLMDEMEELLEIILNVDGAERISYQDLFLKFLNIDPHQATAEQLQQCAQVKNIPVSSDLPNRDAWLDLLLTHYIEPQVGQTRPVFLYDFPETQAALAKVREGSPRVASRFEVYFKGVEVANGFHELQDAKEQAQRFENDLRFRREHGLPDIEIDQRFLAALEHGIPDCSGVALGIDRMVMLALGCESVKDVISFDFTRA